MGDTQRIEEERVFYGEINNREQLNHIIIFAEQCYISRDAKKANVALKLYIKGNETEKDNFLLIFERRGKAPVYLRYAYGEGQSLSKAGDYEEMINQNRDRVTKRIESLIKSGKVLAVELHPNFPKLRERTLLGKFNCHKMVLDASKTEDEEKRDEEKNRNENGKSLDEKVACADSSHETNRVMNYDELLAYASQPEAQPSVDKSLDEKVVGKNPDAPKPIRKFWSIATTIDQVMGSIELAEKAYQKYDAFGLMFSCPNKLRIGLALENEKKNSSRLGPYKVRCAFYDERVDITEEDLKIDPEKDKIEAGPINYIIRRINARFKASSCIKIEGYSNPCIGMTVIPFSNTPTTTDFFLSLMTRLKQNTPENDEEPEEKVEDKNTSVIAQKLAINLGPEFTQAADSKLGSFFSEDGSFSLDDPSAAKDEPVKDQTLILSMRDKLRKFFGRKP